MGRDPRPHLTFGIIDSPDVCRQTCSDVLVILAGWCVTIRTRCYACRLLVCCRQPLGNRLTTPTKAMPGDLIAKLHIHGTFSLTLPTRNPPTGDAGGDATRNPPTGDAGGDAIQTGALVSGVGVVEPTPPSDRLYLARLA